MSYLPASKFGDCTQCGKQDTDCVKKGKELWCIQCNNNAKAQAQIEKSKRRIAARGVQSKLRSGLANSHSNLIAERNYNKLDAWFKDRRKEMVGVCSECGKTTSKGNDKYYKWSICHITPKSLVPSVATNEYNWIELCQQHHQEFDNTFDKAAAMMCFGEVKMKFQLFKNLIPANELRKINPHLLN